jgi:hypothetical protein
VCASLLLLLHLLAVYKANAHPLTTETMLSWNLLQHLRKEMEEKK